MNIRFAKPGDEKTIFNLIRALAEYEKLSDEVVGSEIELAKHLFEPNAVAECLLLSEDLNAEPVGFALYFRNFSTFLTKPGIYLEDLFVLPEYRGKGYGKALLEKIFVIAKERDYRRVDWQVLDWNQPSIEFYEKIGAKLKKEWLNFRMNLN